MGEKATLEAGSAGRRTRGLWDTAEDGGEMQCEENTQETELRGLGVKLDKEVLESS